MSEILHISKNGSQLFSSFHVRKKVEKNNFLQENKRQNMPIDLNPWIILNYLSYSNIISCKTIFCYLVFIKNNIVIHIDERYQQIQQVILQSIFLEVFCFFLLFISLYVFWKYYLALFYIVFVHDIVHNMLGPFIYLSYVNRIVGSFNDYFKHLLQCNSKNLSKRFPKFICHLIITIYNLWTRC